MNCIIVGVSKLVIIGDQNQLPSVGPGEVLKHIIESSTIPVIKLTRIFRQANDSKYGGSDENPIFDLAKSITRGKMPTKLVNDRVKLISQGDSEEIYKIIAKLFAKHKENCQILFPTKKESTVGSIQGNRVIAAAAHDGEVPTVKCGFSKGDKIVCTKNCVQTDENGEIDVKTSIFNGEIGKVYSVDLTTGKIGFISESKKFFVRYDTIEHGWCVTVNKAQGSEYDNVVVVLHPSQGPMLNRQVLYTAVTRAKKRVYIVSTLATLQRAIKTQAPRRHSLLSSLLAMAEYTPPLV